MSNRPASIVLAVVLSPTWLPLSSGVCAQGTGASSAGATVLYASVCEDRRPKRTAYGRSAFSFEFAERSDVVPWRARGDYELWYGAIETDRDLDWFRIDTGAEDRSRIRDLGLMAWADIDAAPALEPNVRGVSRITVSDHEEDLEEVSEGKVAKVHEGHIYLIRTKDRDSDLLVAVRVDRLVPNRRCRISWRVLATYAVNADGSAAPPN